MRTHPNRIIARTSTNPRREVRSGIQCNPKNPLPCNAEAISVSCDTSIHLSCLILKDNITIGYNTSGQIISSAVVARSDLDLELGRPQDIAECVSTTCAYACHTQPSITLPAGICDIQQFGTDTMVTNNNGTYSVIRTFKITDACGNTTLFQRRVSFSANDQTGPVITITPDISHYTQCDPRSNPDSTCECIFLGCNPHDTDIEIALGQATVDRCGVISSPPTTGPFQDGCYLYKKRTWSAKDECCNQSTVCRIVRWVNDTLNPSIVINPVITKYPLPCPSWVGANPNCECVYLGCNPSGADIQTALGTAEIHDNCSTDAPSITTGPVIGNSCNFKQTRSWVVKDLCGNSSKTVCRTVAWKIDHTGPTIQCPASKTLSCGFTGSVSDYFDLPDVFDTCDGLIGSALHQVGNDVTVHYDDGSYTVTRTWTAFDECGNEAQHASQTITVPACPSTIGKACSHGFWRNSNGKVVWDSQSDDVIKAINATGRPFTQSTLFLTYFFPGNTTDRCGISKTVTMLQALSLTGGGCNSLAYQGVAALLNMAYFGSSYAVLTPYSTYEKLYQAIKAALTNCNCSTVAAALGDANTGHEGTYCSSIKDSSAPINKSKLGLQVIPIKKADQPVPAKKTFIPRNA